MWIYQPEKRIWREALNSHFIHCICQNDIYFVHYNDISDLKLKSLENTNIPQNRGYIQNYIIYHRTECTSKPNIPHNRVYIQN